LRPRYRHFPDMDQNSARLGFVPSTI